MSSSLESLGMLPLTLTSACANDGIRQDGRENSEGSVFRMKVVVRPERVELPTFWFVASKKPIINNLRGL